MLDFIKNMPPLAPVDYINTLAKLAESFPDIEQLRDKNPRLYRILKMGPFLPSQNKLTGPYCNPVVATEIIYDTDEYLRSIPPSTNLPHLFLFGRRKQENSETNKLQSNVTSYISENHLRSKL